MHSNKLTIMKSIFLYGAILIFGMTLSSCDDNSDNNQVSNVNDDVQSGTWKITSFIDSGKDETYHFTNYGFEFQGGGVVTAVSSSNTISGTWSITTGSSSSSSNKFNLNFGPDDPFEDLNDDWDIQENSSKKIILMDVSGGNGGTDYLTFEKN